MTIHCEVLTGVDGARIGIATLDAPKALNALNLPMIEVLGEQLHAWARDPGIVCVLLRGNGAKAFAQAAMSVRWRKPAATTPAVSHRWRPPSSPPNTAWTLPCTPTPNRCCAGAMGMCWVVAWGCCKAPMYVSSPPAAGWPCRKSASACTLT